jgi:hypothetical protein
LDRSRKSKKPSEPALVAANEKSKAAFVVFSNKVLEEIVALAQQSSELVVNQREI